MFEYWTDLLFAEIQLSIFCVGLAWVQFTCFEAAVWQKAEDSLGPDHSVSEMLLMLLVLTKTPILQLYLRKIEVDNLHTKHTENQTNDKDTRYWPDEQSLLMPSSWTRISKCHDKAFEPVQTFWSLHKTQSVFCRSIGNCTCRIFGYQCSPFFCTVMVAQSQARFLMSDGTTPAGCVALRREDAESLSSH